MFGEFGFKLGQSVIERLGPGGDAPEFRTTIVEIDGDTCLTATGRYYHVISGGRLPRFEGEYRAIRRDIPPKPRLKATTIPTEQPCR